MVPAEACSPTVAEFPQPDTSMDTPPETPQKFFSKPTSTHEDDDDDEFFVFYDVTPNASSSGLNLIDPDLGPSSSPFPLAGPELSVFRLPQSHRRPPPMGSPARIPTSKLADPGSMHSRSPPALSISEFDVE